MNSHYESKAKRNLAEHVYVLAGDIGERNLARYGGLRDACCYIEGALGGLGYRVRRQAFEVCGKAVANLEVECRGSDNPDEVIIVGAHYDSAQGCPGANDNASGIAALLELAKAFVGFTPSRTLRFVAFVNEEPPYIHTGDMGSMRYVKRCVEAKESVQAMLSLKSIGYFSDFIGSQRYPFPLRYFYPPRGDFIALISNRSSRGTLNNVSAAFASAGQIRHEQGCFPQMLPGVAWSDHGSFWQAGYPAILVTDTAAYRYPHYHSREDTPEKLDYIRLAKVTRSLANAISKLAFDADGTLASNC